MHLVLGKLVRFIEWIAVGAFNYQAFCQLGEHSLIFFLKIFTLFVDEERKNCLKYSWLSMDGI